MMEVRLSHIVHDAHDAKFHALWQQLRDEHEQLTRKGYTGEGFLSKGRQLGGRRIPVDEARRRARAAAEKRRDLNTGSGQRLGGAAVRRGVDMRQVIADAAQRRLTVTQGCGSGTKDTKDLVDQATRNGFRTQAEEDDANERAIMEAYIELIQEEEKEKYGPAYVPTSAQNPSGSVSAGNTTSRPKVDAAKRDDRRTDPTTISISSSTRPIDLSSSTSPILTQASSWTCTICTLENPLDYLCCDACGTERPERISGSIAAGGSQQRSSSSLFPSSSANRHSRLQASESMVKPPGFWICHGCDTVMESQWWTCSTCGAMKLSS